MYFLTACLIVAIVSAAVSLRRSRNLSQPQWATGPAARSAAAGALADNLRGGLPAGAARISSFSTRARNHCDDLSHGACCLFLWRFVSWRHWRDGLRWAAINARQNAPDYDNR
jgi:hypothetical protein